jgi:integrase
MARKRELSSAMGLLPRMEAWRWADGKTITYRYHPVGKKPIPLGTDKQAALRKVLDLTGQRDGHGTLAWVWEKYQESPRWLKLAEGTRADYRLAWKQIDARLGQMHAEEIDAPMVARYVHIERAGSPRRADIEKSLLSRLFGHGIKLGACTKNPTIGVEPHGSVQSTAVPKDDVLQRFLTWLEKQTPQRRIIGMMAEYASLVGSRRVEFLDLSWPQIDEAAGVVRTKRAKQRGAKAGEVIEAIAITPALQALIDRLKVLRQQRGTACLYVFPTRDNNPYNDKGFKTLWSRCRADAIADGALTREDRFTFHQLRAYYATTHKQQRGSLPDLHANPAVTAKVYDRNKVVKRSAL